MIVSSPILDMNFLEPCISKESTMLFIYKRWLDIWSTFYVPVLEGDENSSMVSINNGHPFTVCFGKRHSAAFFPWCIDTQRRQTTSKNVKETNHTCI